MPIIVGLKLTPILRAHFQRQERTAAITFSPGAPSGYADLGDGEFRGDTKHYVVLPPSHHPSGTVYRWKIPFPDEGLPFLDPVQAGLTKCNTQQLPKPTPHIPTHTHTPTHPHTHCICEQEQIPTLITLTLPSRQGERNRKIFEFARRLKNIMPHATGKELKPILRKWYELALPVIATKDWEETWNDFIVSWQRIEHPIGGQWSEIVQAGKEIMVDTSDQ